MFGPLGADKYTEYSRDIRESGEYLLDVINDILDMSKIEAGGIRLAPEAVDWSPFSPTASASSRCAPAKSASISQSRSSRNSSLNADRRALKQIALNLLSNAVKFTPTAARSRSMDASAVAWSPSPSKTTASAFPKIALRKLGRPFEQVESQLTKKYQGSGLGLAIAKSLVELHGGDMRIRSTLGTGTIVIVRLPLQARIAARNGDGRPLAERRVA